MYYLSISEIHYEIHNRNGQTEIIFKMFVANVQVVGSEEKKTIVKTLKQ